MPSRTIRHKTQRKKKFCSKGGTEPMSSLVNEKLVEVKSAPVSNNDIIKHCIKGNNAINSDKISQTFVECLVTDGKGIDKLDTVKEPYFVVKYGPTGSGKGSDKVKEEIMRLGLTDDNTATFEVDRVIEATREFKVGSINIYKKYMTVKRNNKGNPLTEKNKNNENKIIKNVANLYESVRKKDSANNLQKNIMKLALEKGVNIVLETTGMGSLNWIPKFINNNIEVNKYKIVVIYPIVEPETIISRAKSRAKKMVTERGLFRLPSEDFIRQNIQKAKANIISEENGLVPLMENNKIYKIILINNN